MRKILATTTCLSLLLATSGAAASGLSTARFGGERGTPLHSNPTAIYYNPGALGASKGVSIFVDGNIAWRTASYERNAPAGCQSGAALTDCPLNDGLPGGSEVEHPEPSDGQGSNTGKAKLANIAAAPMIGASVKIPITDDGTGIAIGAGFFVPFGGSSSWGKNTAYEGSRYSGAVDGVQRWYAIDGTLRSLFTSGAAAVSIKNLIHVGLSGGVAISQVNTIRAREPSGSNDITREGRAWVDASDVNFHLGGGLMVTPLDDMQKLRLAASYQAPVGINGVNMTGTLKQVHGGTPSEDKISFQQTWPDVIRLGVAFRPIDELELRAFGDYTRWSLFKDQCIVPEGEECEIDGEGLRAGADKGTEPIVNIPRNWQDAGGVRLGASYWPLDTLELMLGLGYDSTAIASENLDPAILDFHDISVALSARFQIVDQFAASLGYTQFFYVPVDVTPEESANPKFKGNSRGPDNSGEYSQNIGVININVELSFDPFDEKKSEPAAPAPTQ
jgi:long-chain fatty acid transport protein